MKPCDHYPSKRLTRMGDMQCSRCGAIYLIEVGGCRWSDRPHMPRKQGGSHATSD